MRQYHSSKVTFVKRSSISSCLRLLRSVLASTSSGNRASSSPLLWRGPRTSRLAGLSTPACKLRSPLTRLTWSWYCLNAASILSQQAEAEKTKWISAQSRLKPRLWGFSQRVTSVGTEAECHSKDGLSTCKCHVKAFPVKDRWSVHVKVSASIWPASAGFIRSTKSEVEGGNCTNGPCRTCRFTSAFKVMNYGCIVLRECKHQGAFKLCPRFEP